MSHMPHSHDIVGPGTARGTSHSQDLLLCIAHTALEPAGQEEKVNSPSQSGSGSQLFHKSKDRPGMYSVPSLTISQVRNCLLGHEKHASTHSIRQAIFSFGQVMFIGKQ